MKISLEHYHKIIFFTGAGMSAESGVPTYRGRGGIWNEYKWEEYACQNAFDKNPEFVLNFHQLRRIEALKCNPHHDEDYILKPLSFLIGESLVQILDFYRMHFGKRIPPIYIHSISHLYLYK